MLVDLRPDERRRTEETLQRIHLQIGSGPASTEEAEVELLHVLWAHNIREEAVHPWFDTHPFPDLVRSVHQALPDTETRGDPADESARTP